MSALERLNEIGKAARAAAEEKAREDQERSAAEAAAQERAEQRRELANERESVLAEIANTEQGAKEAAEAVAQAEALETELGESLDATTIAEIATIKADNQETVRKFEELKAQLEKIDADIASLEADGGQASEEVESMNPDAPAESPAAEAPTDDRESERAAAEQKKADIERDIEVTQLLLDEYEARLELGKEAQEILANNRSAIDVLTYDTEEVANTKNALRESLLSPILERQRALEENLSNNGIEDPQAERAKFFDDFNPWGGNFSDVARKRIEKLRRELAKNTGRETDRA